MQHGNDERGQNAAFHVLGILEWYGAAIQNRSDQQNHNDVDVRSSA
jgi:hypothetical protein